MLRTCVSRAAGRLRSPCSSSWRPGIFSVCGTRYNSTDAGAKNVEISKELPSFDAAGSVDMVSNVAAGASENIGYLESIGLAESWIWPTGVIQHVLEYVHVYGGMPWWATICATTIAARVLLFPLYVKHSDMFARTSQVKPEMDDIHNRLRDCTDKVELQNIALERRLFLEKHGIKNRYLAVPMLQIPVAIAFFTGIRQMANYPVEGFAQQGILWFGDLTQADPYLGLQCMTAALFMGLAHFGGESGAQQFSAPMKKLFTYLPLLTIPATMSLSSGVVLYLATNGICSAVQTILLRNKYLREKLKIAEIVHRAPEKQQPSKGIKESVKDYFAKAREQAEKRSEMAEKERKMFEAVREEQANAKIKIIRRADLKKK